MRDQALLDRIGIRKYDRLGGEFFALLAVRERPSGFGESLSLHCTRKKAFSIGKSFASQRAVRVIPSSRLILARRPNRWAKGVHTRRACGQLSS